MKNITGIFNRDVFLFLYLHRNKNSVVEINIDNFIKQSMGNKQDYIHPTKENPIFKCWNNYLGYIENTIYKEWEIHEGEVLVVGSTFETNLSRAIVKLHDYIREYQEDIEPKSSFTILMVNGSFNKYGEINETKCYSISMKQAKQFKLIS